jgi:hypothetical protein
VLLLPCIVCGERTTPLSKVVAVFEETEAAQVLGHPPPAEQAVLDPVDRTRKWLGHEECTGVPRDRGAEVLTRRLREQRQNKAANWSLEQVVAELERILSRPRISASAKARLRELGQEIHSRGGMDLMLAAHRLISLSSGPADARLLEFHWDNIGDWRG